MDKKTVRKEINLFFRKISDEKLLELSRKITSRLIGQEIWNQAEVILAFLTFGKEIETSFLINQALKEKKKVAVPRLYGKNMKFHFIESLNDQFEVNKWEIREPLTSAPLWKPGENKTLMLTPGLAFNLEGGRLGRGGGFYDLFLAECGKDLQTTGLCFEQQIRDDFPVEEYDYRLDTLCSDSRFYSF